jgi:hypothetical protein
MGMSYKFLSDLLERAWDAHEKVPLRSFFGKELKKLSQDDLRNLVSWWLKCFQIKAGADEVTSIAESVAKGHSVVIGDVAMKSDVLSRFLACISLAEYGKGDLTPHSQDLRFREIGEICKMVGLPEEKVLKIHSYWHQHLRQKVLAPVRGKTRKSKSRRSLDSDH